MDQESCYADLCRARCQLRQPGVGFGQCPLPALHEFLGELRHLTIQLLDDVDGDSAREYRFQHDRVMAVGGAQQSLQANEVSRSGEPNDPLRSVREVLLQLHQAFANRKEVVR